MNEFFDFVLNFRLRCFRGRTGTIALSSLVGASFYLWLWGLELNLPHTSGYRPVGEMWWWVIIPLSFVAVSLMVWNQYDDKDRDCDRGTE